MPNSDVPVGASQSGFDRPRLVLLSGHREASAGRCTAVRQQRVALSNAAVKIFSTAHHNMPNIITIKQAYVKPIILSTVLGSVTSGSVPWSSRGLRLGLLAPTSAKGLFVDNPPLCSDPSEVSPNIARIEDAAGSMRPFFMLPRVKQ